MADPIKPEDISPEPPENPLAVALARIEAVRAIWPHIEFPAKRSPIGSRTVDPGAPTCIRCKIEDAISAVKEAGCE